MASSDYSTPLLSIEAVVLDTETTGLDAQAARIVQIGMVRLSGGAIVPGDQLDQLVNPGIAIPPSTTAVHHITDADVRDAPAFAAIAPAVERFIGGAFVIGHTTAYDLVVLERESRRAGLAWRQPRALDVRVLAELALPTLAQYDLDRIAHVLSIPIEGRHTALGDALAAARIYLALVPLLRQKDIRTIAEVERASRALLDRQLAAGSGRSGIVPAAADQATVLERIDSFAYRHLIRDVMSAPVIWCEAGTTVGAALRLLIERRVSSVLVRDASGTPGIATERDLIRAIDRDGAAALGADVSSFANRPLQTARDDSFVYRAIGRLDRLGFRHLPVTDAAGSIVGMVTTRNLLRHRASTAVALGDAVDAATSPGELAAAWSKLPRVTRALIEEEVDPRLVARVVSTEVCALTRRAAELAELRLRDEGRGGPPVPYAVLVLGSAGRGESLLAADQDNAIVYASGAPGGAEDQWFAALARHMCDALDVAGVPYCKGGVMATNERWRKSREAWGATIDGWVRRQRPEDMLNVDIFFDAVVVHGDEALGEAILAHAFARAAGARDFLAQLAELARRWRPALSIFGRLKTGADGRFDLKLNGLLPVFTAARALAIRHGARVRSTPARLEAVTTAAAISQDQLEALIEAHRTVLRSMLHQQLLDIETGIPPSPRIDPKRLSARELATLKTALQRVSIAALIAGEGRI